MWIDIKGYEGIYQFNTKTDEVKRLERTVELVMKKTGKKFTRKYPEIIMQWNPVFRSNSKIIILRKDSKLKCFTKLSLKKYITGKSRLNPEDLKCCGNCNNINEEEGYEIYCNIKNEVVQGYELCENWLYDGLTKEDRL